MPTPFSMPVQPPSTAAARGGPLPSLLPSGRAEDGMPSGRSIVEETGGLCREIFGPRAVARAVSGGSEAPTPAASDKAEYVAYGLALLHDIRMGSAVRA